MPKNNNNKSKIIDDISQLAGGAVGLLNGVGQQVRGDMKARIEDMAADMDLIPRDEFERVEALLQKALTDNEDIKKRLEKLEKNA
jgi:BMFP domain-containing protein YqiC